MPANLIIFDADYISTLTSRMNEACMLVDEAVAALKQASLHEGWKCKENARISSEIDDLNIRLGRLDEGVNETVRVLGGSVSRFAELESKYETQANSLSDELTTNHGFQASTHESSGTSGVIGGHSGPSGNPGVDGSGTHAGAGAGAGVGGMAGAGAGARVNFGGANMGRNMPNINMNQSTVSNSNFVNLPVTHIPDRPEAVAKGIKDTQEISDIAVDSVADSITHVLSGHAKVRVIAPDGSDRTVQNLVDTYNAGKAVSDNSASIISNPTVSHVEEHLAIATGLVTLAGSTLTGFGMLASSSVSNSGSFNSVKASGAFSSASITEKAQELLPTVKNIPGSEELSNVLTAISSSPNATSASSTQSNSGESFFQKIINALFGKMDNQGSGEFAGGVFENSPVQEFFNSFVAE